MPLKALEALGSSNMFKAETLVELKTSFTDFITCSGPSFLEVKVQPGSREDLGRPTIKPVDNKVEFMSFVEE